MTSPLDRVIHPDDRLAIFIDGANLYSAAKAIAFEMDYRKLLDAFGHAGRLIRASYYTAQLEGVEFSPIQPLIDWLDYNGYRLVTKPAKEYIDGNGKRRIKGDMDVEIAVDMLEAAGWCDHQVLFSGDSDFISAIAAVQRKGVRVSVVSTLRAQPPMIGDDLRRQADHFFELADLGAIIGREARA